jgi:signal transduction histidine kinase
MLHDTGLYQAVARDISERKNLHQHFLASIEAERRTLGQELHDGLCQELKSLEMTAVLLEETLLQDNHPASGTMETMGKDINRMVVSAYGLAAGMLPASLDTRYFGDALRKLAKNLQRSSDVSVEIHVPADIQLKSDMAANHLYRIVQEAAGNAIRHGRATTLVFECRRSETEFVIRIIDDGHGFEIKETTVGGLGISVMRSRAEALGGSLRIDQRPSGGVQVICACPPDILQGEHHA